MVRSLKAALGPAHGRATYPRAYVRFLAPKSPFWNSMQCDVVICSAFSEQELILDNIYCIFTTGKIVSPNLPNASHSFCMNFARLFSPIRTFIIHGVFPVQFVSTLRHFPPSAALRHSTGGPPTQLAPGREAEKTFALTPMSFLLQPRGPPADEPPARGRSSNQPQTSSLISGFQTFLGLR